MDFALALRMIPPEVMDAYRQQATHPLEKTTNWYTAAGIILVWLTLVGLCIHWLWDLFSAMA